MVSIQPNFGAMGPDNVNGTQKTTVEPQKKPETAVDPFKIYHKDQNGKYVLVYDDGKNDGIGAYLQDDGTYFFRDEKIVR